jgi:outer membrane usher protein
MFKRPCAHSRLFTTPGDRPSLRSAIFFFILVLVSFFPWPAAAESTAGNIVVSANSDNPDVALNELARMELASRFSIFQKPTTQLVVDISVNTESKGDFFVEMDDQGELYFKVEDLVSLKLSIADDASVLIKGEKFAPVSAIRDVRTTFDINKLTVSIIGKTLEKQYTSIEVYPSLSHPQNLYFQKEQSAFVNYGLSYVYSDPLGFQAFTASNKLGARSGDVFFISDSLYTKTEFDSQFVRLTTSATYERKDDLQWLVVGDQFARSGDLGGTINIGGIGFSKVYRMDPYFMTQPMFNLKGVTAYPTQAEIYMDGVLVGRQAVPPGAFEMKNIYSYGGVHSLEILLRDPFGNEQRIAYPLYFDVQLLREGLHEYSYNAGFLREQYGVMSNEYGKPAFSAFHRYGVTSFFNIGARAEGSDDVYNVGFSTAFTMPKVGSFALSLANSSANSHSGYAGSFVYSYQHGSFNTTLHAIVYSRDYATVSAPASLDMTRFDRGFGLGFLVPKVGSMAFSYSENATYGGLSTRVTSANYSRDLTRNTSFFATASATHTQDTTYGFFIGLNFTPAKNVHGTAQYNKTGDVNTETLQIQNDIPIGEGVGYRASLMRSTDGTSTIYSANPSLQYNARYGIYSLDMVAQNSSGKMTESYTIGAAGSFVYAGGFYGIARPVNDSFSIVMVSDVPHAKVFNNGIAIGETGQSGMVVVPSLFSYNQNLVSVDAKDIPMDYAMSGVNAKIFPSLWGGSCISFDALKVRAVTGSVFGVKGDKKIPLEFVDISIKAADREVTAPTGRNGEFYIENTLPEVPTAGAPDKQSCRAIAERRKSGGAVIQPGTYRASVAYEGGKCEFSITFPVTDDVITDLGEIRCVLP